ncbi:unnamed protein product [Durusdinium trenchii]|uniref:Uncharacterized protein n=1 Tax=Durusdinium trenchii TaxID=1381693 RepID=A0ABP0NA29_9DINO
MRRTGLMSFGALRQMNKSLKGRNKRWKRTLSDRSFLEAAVLRGQVSGSNEDLKKQPFTNFLDRARLMNLEAVLKAEEDTVKDEEKDVERSASRGKAYEKDEGYSRDQQRLKSFSKLADRLRFSNEESQELSDLQQKLKFQ